MTSLLQDLRFALRQMRRSPGFAATAVFTLALGIAANVIVFGVLQAFVLRPIDVPNADRVMTLAHTDQDYPIFSYPEVRDVRDGNTVFSAVAAVDINKFWPGSQRQYAALSGDTKSAGNTSRSSASSRSSGDCCNAPMTIIRERRRPRCFPGLRGRVILAQIPTSWARPFA